MSGLLTFDAKTGSLLDARGAVVAELGRFADPAWGPRLARIGAFETAAKKILRAECFDERIRGREALAKLVAAIEECSTCRGPAEKSALCDQCGQCERCCPPESGCRTRIALDDVRDVRVRLVPA